MKYRLSIFGIILFMLLGCSSTPEAGNYSAHSENTSSNRYLVRSGSINLEVKDIDAVSGSINGYVNEVNGYVDNSTRWDRKRVSISARIPEKNFDSFIEKLSDFGKITSKSISVRDVTEEIVDIGAKLNNLLALRERFRKLLDRAEKVSEVLEIEKELSRIQTEIDSIEGRKAKLLGQINYSKVEIHLERETIYGPIGYVGVGLYWIIEKLFVIK